MADSEHQSQNSAVAKAHDIDLLKLQHLEQRRSIFHHRGVTQWPGYVRRASLAHLIRRHYMMMFRKYVELAHKGMLAGIAAAVQKDQCRTIAASGVVNLVTVNCGPMPLDRLNLGLGRVDRKTY